MAKAVKGGAEPLQAKDFFSQFDAVPSTFGNVKTRETTRQLPSFDPAQYTDIENPTPYGNPDVLQRISANNQPYYRQAFAGLTQFGANFASGFGQGLANLVDVSSWGADNYQSSLFGLSTKDMQNWANNVAQRNQIKRENPGSFDPGSFGWWMEQAGSSGTGLGMGAFALAETAAIEYLTGGLGTGAALGRLGKLFETVRKTRGAEAAVELVNTAKDLRSAATAYGILNRVNESRMEAMQSYDDIYNTMSQQKNPDGTAKYTEGQLKQFSAAGAQRTFRGNMLLLPLDILSYRTMVYNPISGAGEGFIEKLIGKIGNKYMRKATQFGVGSLLEGSEEGFQFVASEEGKHYAQVLGGTSDRSSFMSRLGRDVNSDEFWNNFAGGVVGSPIIGGFMNITNKLMTGNRTAKLNSVHDDYVTNIAQMDSEIAKKIKDLQLAGRAKEAGIYRRQYRANKALAALHLDAMTDRDGAFESHLNFLQGVLDEVNNGKTDALEDLGFANPTPEQVQDIKTNFQDSIRDAQEMKNIYDNVKNKYNRNFVPEVAMDYFQLNRLTDEKTANEQKLGSLQSKLFQYSQLSPLGREQYDSEYKLASYIAEQARLSDQFRETKDTHEKRNIEDLIAKNKEDITKLKIRLDEIGKDETYDTATRRSDMDILDSALRDKEYAQAMYDSERLNSEISLKRKNVALWNNKEYLANKTKESISKAKTVEQVDSTEEEMNKKGTVTPETKESLDSKRAELLAKSLVEAESVKGNEVLTDDFNGNANLFEEDNSLIDSITSAVPLTPQQGDPENTPPANAQVFILEPEQFDFENSSEESKAKVINGVRGLADRLGNSPKFEDLVRHVIKVQGVDVADKIYNALQYGWEKNGFEAADYKAIYDKLFGNPMDDLLAGAKQLTVKQATAEINKVGEDVVKHQQQPAAFVEGQPQYNYTGFVTTEASPKMAFVSRLSQLIRTTDEEGNVTVSHEYTEDELNQGGYVDSLQLLDPDKYNEGTEMEIRIPDNYLEIMIPMYNSDGTKGKTISFGEYVAVNQLNPDMQEYQDKIPMIIYRKGAAKNEKGLAFVHDVSWYNYNSFHQGYKDNMEEATSNTRGIRKAVLGNPDNKEAIVITGKRQTTFEGLKTKPGTDITLAEANPETTLTVATGTNQLSVKRNEVAFPNNKVTLVNTAPFVVGTVYDVRRFGTKDGKETYAAFPVLKPKLDDKAKSSVLQAINIYANRTNTTKEVREKHDSIVAQIKDKMGLDILSSNGLEKYLQHFIATFNTEKASENRHAEEQAKAKLAPGTPYIAFLSTGNIVVGKAGEAAYVDKQGNKKGSFFINPSSTQSSVFALSALRKPDMIGWYEHNTNLSNLDRNKPVLTIDQNLNVEVAANSYDEYLKSKLRTNMKSYNIGTEEKPNYVTNIQPVITYELKSKLSQSQPSNEQVKEEIIPKEEERTDKGVPSTEQELSDAEKAWLEQTEKDLGNDLGISKKNKSLLDAATLTEEQRKEIAGSINRIAGLTPDQQFDIVDFMYNQITTLVNLETKQVDKQAVDKHVEITFNDVVKPLKEYYEERIKFGEELIKQKPALANSRVADDIEDYKYRVNKIGFVQQSMDILKEEAYNRVAKYTGITANRVESASFQDDVIDSVENPNTTDEENPNQKERDFWTDILQENPESKLSYTMRRFFGQIRDYDKNGEPLTGFLSLPVYVGADQVTRTMMQELADVPANFDLMLAKLKEKQEAIPWMKEAITKLEGATQQQKAQFVTVMANTRLRMRFTMISYDRKSDSYTTKVWDTHLNGIADTVRKEWINNFINSDLVIIDEAGNITFNKEKGKHLIQQFEAWTGRTVETVPFDLSSYRAIVDKVKPGKAVEFMPAPNIVDWLNTQLNTETDRVKFPMKGQEFQITKGGNTFRIEYLNKTVEAKDADKVSKWLEGFGITLSEGTLKELTEKGLYHNYQQRGYNDLFTTGTNTNGLFGILYNSLRNLVAKDDVVNFTEDGGIPLEDTVIKSLANLESKYNTTSVPFGFRDNGKSYFALTAPKFITDRVRDLKDKNDTTTLRQLRSISFSSGSMWLELLESDASFADKFSLSHIGANAFKELGKRLYRDNAITKLSDVDHELTKLGMFWDMNQGEITTVYPGTSVERRVATVFSPTMSDKHLMTLIGTAVLNLNNSDLNNGQGMSKDVMNIIYEQTVKPELKRMIKFWQNGGETNIAGYDRGAAMFLLMPVMNNIEIIPGLKLVDAIRATPDNYSTATVESNNDLMAKINHEIKSYIDTLVEEKLKVWQDNGIISRDGKDEVTGMKFFDKKYKAKFRGTNTEIAKMAAMDYVINYMVANANSFMTLAGDPALYFKSKATDALTKAKDTFTNAGKRLANQIAPGTALSNSENEKYLQLFIEDRKSMAETPFLKYVTKINDGQSITDEELEKLRTGSKAEKEAVANKYPVSAGYFSIEGSDAQEYTTWKEHLDVIAKLGKTPDTLLDITPEEIAEARDIFSSGKNLNTLTEKQQQIIGKVLQPIKPVYTGQLFDANQDVMRTMYIKSSSFPLIPQLTAGFEIDKLRDAMEKLEKKSKLNVRASYQTANKVGAVTAPASIWKADGTIDQEQLDDINKHDWFDKEDGGTYLDSPVLVLDRKNFRIQQEIPYKSGKAGESKITLGTQLMKLLFGDEVMTLDGFSYNGKEYNGTDLHKIYNNLFIDLIKENRAQLHSELGLDAAGIPIDAKKSTIKLQQLLKEEATKRGYPLQDIEGLTLTATGEFNLPLWASSNSNRYESMLNSIVTNRVVKMKFPGYSFVVGSEEGFRKQETLEGVDKSRIIYTSAWNGKSLQAAYHANGELKKAQVFISSKFKMSDGRLIDLFEKENGEHKYVTKVNGSFMLNENMIDKELLSMITFRIPTSGHQSATQVEIAGFLPAESADLMIVPRNFTKQKGLDFDIDKENAYNLWTYVNSNGKVEVLDRKHKAQILAEADQALKSKDGEALEKLFSGIFGDISKVDVEEYTDEEIAADKKLAKLSSKLEAKFLQNELIKINHSVMGSSNEKMQAKINKTLNTDFAEEQAEKIEGFSAKGSNAYWTPLSDEYQKQKMMMGASGKIGTGAYSLDVVFHSLAQQASVLGKAIELTEVVGEDENTQLIPKTWTFGNITSDGKLGRAKTLDGNRTIAEVMAERQNVAVDNEKLQIMGKVNLNDITMDVDKVMNMVGFDKGEDGNSISFLFLSQPIIKDFVNKLRNANSNVADFESDKEGKAVEELLKKYEGTETVIADEAYWKEMSARMTNADFIAAIKSNGADGKLQGAVLRRFIEMRKYGIAIRSIQTTINTDSRGLGKSFFDVIERRESLNRLGANTDMIRGASNLIGDFVDMTEITHQQIADLAELGYVDIGNYMVKPDSLTGAFNVFGVSSAYNLWNKFFPYDAAVTKAAFREVMSIISTQDASDSTNVEYKQEIFREMKKYLATARDAGMMGNEDTTNGLRASLFIDSEENTSLAKYVKTLKEMNGNPVVDAFIKSNKLFNRFEFDIQKNGQPSLIKYNNAAGEEFDEQYLYESLATLIELRGTTGSMELPQIGNKKYTLDTLAQALISYCYLGNAIQEAIQFTKYVPVSYLNAVGYAATMRNYSKTLEFSNDVLGVKIGSGEKQAHLVSEFTMQFIQHNPERVREKYTADKLKASIVANKDGSFVFKDSRTPTFVSVYDTSVAKGQKKFKLYWFDGAKYNQIPVLGVFGMDEYQKGTGTGDSIVNGKVKNTASPQSAIGSITAGEESVYSLKSGEGYSIMKTISEDASNEIAPLAKQLLPFTEGIVIKVSDTIGEGADQTTVFNGIYDTETKVITVNTKLLADKNKLAATVVHEVIHRLTYDAVDPHVTMDANGTAQLLSNQVPEYVADVVMLYNSLRMGINNNTLKLVENKVRSRAPLTEEEKAKYYGFTSIHEFMAMAMSNKGFQELLSTIEYRNTGKTFLDKFKEFVAKVLVSVGIKFDEKYSLAHAISSIFEVIERSNLREEDNPYQAFTEYNDEFGLDNMEDGEAVGILEPSTREEIFEAAKAAIIRDVKNPAFKAAFLSNVELTLKEVAIQLNSGESNFKNVVSMYGEEVAVLAAKLFPNETIQTKNVDDYIDKLNSNQIDC